MAYKFVNADQLDSDLTSVGNAIRSKSGTSAKLSFPSGMVSAIGAISTGVELNFDVVGGTSKPRKPKENMIWVNTSTTISSWVFSATQPTAASGRVWIPTGISSAIEFNALKKNSIQVYPTSVRQYINGAFVNKEAHIYHAGDWKKFSDEVFYLFSAEKGINEGTWNKKTLSSDIGTFSVDSQKVYLYSKEDNTAYAMVAVNDEPINTAGKSKLIVSMSVSGNVSSTSAFGLSTSPTNTTCNSAMVATKKLDNGDLELDIATLNEICYFKVWLNSTGSAYTATCTITEIKTV